MNIGRVTYPAISDPSGVTNRESDPNADCQWKQFSFHDIGHNAFNAYARNRQPRPQRM
jgi:hypothetical protein